MITLSCWQAGALFALAVALGMLLGALFVALLVAADDEGEE